MAHIERSFSTKFCWCGRYKFEAWLNFTRVASRSLSLELLIEILSKEPIWRQMVKWRGSTSKVKSFCCGWFVDILLDCTSGAVYAWLLGDKKLFSRRFASDFEKFFIALATLTYKILPESEQNLNFLKQIKNTFFDKKWLMKFSKFRLNSD